MFEFKTHVSLLLITEDTPILDALKRLELTQMRLLICVDGAGRLAGVVSDGDIRRALIGGHTPADPVSACVNRRPVFVSEQAGRDESLARMSERVSLVPVVDATHTVVGYYSQTQAPARHPEVQRHRLCVIGLGYVGLTLAVAFAATGATVIGHDVNRAVLARLRRKEAPFFEVGLQSQLETHVGRNLIFVDDLESERADVFVVAVGTPIDKKTLKPDLTAVRAAAALVGRHLDKGKTVIMRSTLPVGCSREVVLPALEAASGLSAGTDFRFAFAPERTVEGRALPELRTNPQIVGGLDAESAEFTRQLFGRLTHSVVDVGSLEAAELCKLMDNTYRDHMFAFANQMAALTEALGLDFNLLADAVNYGYPRNRVPKPSPGVGGPCLSKDPYILASVFEAHGLAPALTLAARAVNEAGPDRVADKLERLLARAGKRLDAATVTVIGLAFKGEPETSDVRDSTALGVVERLRGCRALRAFDPVVADEDLANLGAAPVDLSRAFAGADAVVVLNNHRSYANWNLARMLGTMNHPAVFIDTWHTFDPMDVKTARGILYGGLGND